MKKLRIQLRAVFYKESATWIAHCLEMDVMGHGRTKQKAFASLKEAITLQLANSLQHGNRANIFMPADAKFFEMYMAGKDTAAGDVEIHEVEPPTTKRKREPAPYVVEELQTREACFA